MTEAIKLFSRVALLSDGTTVPITNLYDEEGDETDAPDEAVSFVAGDGDRWLSGLVNDYEEASVQ